MEFNQWLNTQIGKDIWEKKYRYNNETLDEWFVRVSGGNNKIKELMVAKKFLPAGRILSNRGLYKLGRKTTYSNCYVISPPEDNIESIFDCAKKLARTFSFGGGCGVDISKLAPKGAKVNNAAKETTGAVSFMDLYSLTTELIGQNGRRGALMLSIDCNHPDLEDFINIKSDLKKVTKANISVKITDEFMNAVKNNLPYMLVYTRKETGETIKKEVNAKQLFYQLAKMNWAMAEPGILNWDRIKNWNLLSEDNNFEYAGVNPCAEEPLPAGGSCLLGSINLSNFVINPFTDKATFDVKSFEDAVKEAVIYLNEVLDEGLELHPLDEQQKSVRDWRQIGLGLMGIADMFIKLGIRYGSQKSIQLSHDIGFKMIDTAIATSAILAKQNGTYPRYNKEAILGSKFFNENTSKETKALVKDYGLYNSQLLTIAPTGSISTMLGISGGIEPIYNISYTRKTESLHGKEEYYKIYTPIVEDFMKLKGITDEKDLPDYFVTAMTLNYQDRINIQSAWQSHIDASISSTVNVPENFTIEDVEKLYIMAWEKGLKGVTIYRDNCSRSGILINNTAKVESEKPIELPWGTVLESSDDLIGKKRKINSGCGSLHVQAWFDPFDGRLLEVFLSKGGTGGCASYMVGLSRTLSLALRTGAPFDYVIDQLKSVPACPSYVGRTLTYKDTSKGSNCPNAIGYALVEMQKEVFDDLGIDEEMQEEIKGKKNTCPECGEPAIYEGGCISCKLCGWSRCN